MRVGIGKASLLGSDTSLCIGGITLPAEGTADKNNKFDILILSIADALMGAIGLGGVTQDEEFKKLPAEQSSVLLRKAENKVHYNGYQIVNIDSVISASDPEFVSHIQKIKEHISAILFIKPEQINIKHSPYLQTQSRVKTNQSHCISIVLLQKRS